MRVRHRSAVVIGILAVLTTLLGVPPSATAAGPGTTLSVTLTVSTTSAVWGDEVTFTVGTNRPTSEGFLQILRVQDGSRFPVASLDADGSVTVDTRGMPLGESEFIAVANKDELYAESFVRYLTLTARPTTIDLESSFADPMERFHVTVGSGLPSLVPSGSVKVTSNGTSVVAPLDGTGRATFDGLPPGNHQLLLEYVCEAGFACSSKSRILQVHLFPLSVTAEFSAAKVRPGAPASLRFEIESAHPDYPPTGQWKVVANSAARPTDTVVASGTYAGPVDVYLDSWTATREGVWSFRLIYQGDGRYDGTWPISFGTLEIGETRSATETVLDPPVLGVPVGGVLSVRVSADGVLPAGPVTLHLEDGTVVATDTVLAGLGEFTLPATLPVGVHQVWASYDGNESYSPSVSPLVSLAVIPLDTHLPDPGTPDTPDTPGTPGTPGTPLPGPGTPAVPDSPGATPAKATSAVLGRVVGKRGKAVLTLAIGSRAQVTGKVQVRDGSRLLRTVSLSSGRAKLTLAKLRKGRHRLTVSYLGSTTVAPSARTWAVRIR